MPTTRTVYLAHIRHRHGADIYLEATGQELLSAVADYVAFSVSDLDALYWDEIRSGAMEGVDVSADAEENEPSKEIVRLLESGSLEEAIDLYFSLAADCLDEAYETEKYEITFPD